MHRLAANHGRVQFVTAVTDQFAAFGVQYNHRALAAADGFCKVAVVDGHGEGEGRCGLLFLRSASMLVISSRVEPWPHTQSCMHAANIQIVIANASYLLFLDSELGQELRDLLRLHLAVKLGQARG